MTGLLIGILLALVGVGWFIAVAAKGRQYTISQLAQPLMDLRNRGFHTGTLIVEHQRSKMFLQFRKCIRKKGDYGIELAFPNAEWSRSYLPTLQDHCETTGLNYLVEREHDDHPMEFLYVDLGKDVEAAHTLLKYMFETIFSLPAGSKYYVRLENASSRNEVIDSLS